jgi:hypothetical protein
LAVETLFLRVAGDPPPGYRPLYFLKTPTMTRMGRVKEKSLRPEITKNMVCERLWELAQVEPEQSRGSLTGQVDCCEQMYRLFKFEPALQRLNELASIDPSRTGGRRTSQDKAAKLLKRIVSSLETDKGRVQ